MTDTLKYINLAMESWGLLFCLLAVTILLIATHIDRKTKRYFLAIFSFLFLDLLANMGGLLLRGRSDAVGRFFLRFANFNEYFWGDALTLVLTLYLLYLIDRREKKLTRIWHRAAWTIFAAAVALLVITQFTGLFYSVDAGGIYHRGPLFWLSQAIAIGTLVMDIVLIVCYRERLSRAERISFCVYVCVPIVAIFMQLFFYGVYFLLLSSTLAAVFMLGAIILDQTEQYYRTEQELAQMRSALVLSQVQPHFLYNSLTAIAALCEHAPAEAKEATLAFAEYLRTNMNALNAKGTVPFATELKHIETYLYLEQLRFGEDLLVDMDIEVTDFSLPALTIQPLVENAVKWGVCQDEDGGMVKLTTRETPLGVEVTVSDDGVGFDPEHLPQDGKDHLGLQLVRDRLKMVCGAKLTVESKIGQGTVVRVFIPRNLD
ncbi:sensor histidine kinase [Intestinimonas sp. MSJ-38]|uniref:sensor histidine kinase n=1 Tax=Intestinimonas sp. MSJ-38 TaxID=2841532 RepID=UPI001C1052E1|nr:histidine kinase [Intestinimonas sp. MSJ-38]MBU5433019.1 histidine kinase [Intestinimonas sp. MSJ-38]